MFNKDKLALVLPVRDTEVVISVYHWLPLLATYSRQVKAYHQSHWIKRMVSEMAGHLASPVGE